MELLLLIQSLVTHLPSLIEAPWPSSLLGSWFILHPFGLGIETSLLAGNPITPLCPVIELMCISLPEE